MKALPPKPSRAAGCASQSSGNDSWAILAKREQRGSRARCISLTNASDDIVASRLSTLASPLAIIDPNRHYWMPRGLAAPKEAKLGDRLPFLSDECREAVTSWWLAVREQANTPNWDIASTATIGGAEGLLLVEAKAHSGEIKTEGKSVRPRSTATTERKTSERQLSNHARNHAQIEAACGEASTALNAALPGWALSVQSRYQLCNRFAWAWKIASLGIPVVLVYLGFIRADEMSDQGLPFIDGVKWEHLVREHSKGIIPATAWDRAISVNGTPLHAVIRSME